MSRWSPEKELRIAVGPVGVTLLMVQRRLTLHGWQRTLHDAYSVPCDGADAGPPWRAALQELASALPGYAGGKVGAKVILSNHFLRYALVPWSDELADADEELAFVRHCFVRIYGESAQRWALRVNAQANGEPLLACAADAELLDALRGVCDGAGIALRSVQPYLMAAFNGCRRELGSQDAWFALFEPGNLCVALLRHGSWQRLRSLRVDDAWQDEIPLILEREACLGDLPEVPHEVYLWNATGATAPPDIGGWRVHALNPAREAGAAPEPWAWTMAGGGDARPAA